MRPSVGRLRDRTTDFRAGRHRHCDGPRPSENGYAVLKPLEPEGVARGEWQRLEDKPLHQGQSKDGSRRGVRVTGPSNPEGASGQFEASNGL